MSSARVTIKDIAAAVGVSKSLVSMHLNNHPLSRHIADKTKKKIDAAVRKFNYNPSATARALRQGKSRTIGLVIGDISAASSSSQTEMFLNEAVRHDYQLLISVTRYRPQEEINCIDTLIHRQTDGIICYVSPNNFDAKAVERLRRYPLLFPTHHPAFDSVSYGRRDSLDAAMARFRALGLRRVAALVGPRIYGSDWHDPLQTACDAHGLSAVMIEDGETMNHPARLAGELRRQRADAVLSMSSLPIMRLIHYGIDHGIRPLPGIYSYSRPFDYIGHESVVGAIVNPVKVMTQKTIARIVEMVERPEPEIQHLELPSRFLDRAELTAHCREQMDDPFFGPSWMEWAQLYGLNHDAGTRFAMAAEVPATF